MNYVNNWLRAIDLEQGATSCPLDLPDGEYRLTLADAAAGATRWEIVDAVVAAGSATLTRAREGTADQDWPTGSVIYCGLTAATLAALSSGGSSITVSADQPAQTPGAAGLSWLVTTHPFQRLFVSVGTTGPEDWMPLAECPPLNEYQASTFSTTVALDRSDKEVGIGSPYQEAGQFGITLTIPAWSSNPAGFVLKVEPQPAATIALALDFAALINPGEVFTAALVDYTGSGQGSADGSVVTLEIAERVRLSDLLIERWDDEGTPHVHVQIEMRNARDPVPDFIALTGA